MKSYIMHFLSFRAKQHLCSSCAAEESHTTRLFNQIKFLSFNPAFISGGMRSLRSAAASVGMTKDKIYLVFGILFIILPFFQNKAYADGISLSLSPSLIEIRTNPPSDVRAPLTLTNQGDTSVQVQTVYKFFRQSDAQNGQVVYAAPQKILDKISLLDNDEPVTSVTLGPKEEKRFELDVSLPKDEQASDYYFSLIFIASGTNNTAPSSNPSQNNTSSIQAGVAANILLSVGPKEQANASIEDFSAPWYAESGPVGFRLAVKNQDVHFIAPKGVILIKNMFGQTVGRVDVPETVILANSTRSLTNNLSWNEKFLLGFYTATLSLAVSGQGPLYQRSIHFMAFPVHFIIGLILFIVVSLLIYLRVKARLRE